MKSTRRVFWNMMMPPVGFEAMAASEVAEEYRDESDDAMDA